MATYYKFAKKVFLFSLPIIALLILPFCVIFWGREYYPIHQIIETQQQHPDTLFNLCCSNIRRKYKEDLLETLNPRIIALGTSRVLQFRQEMFNNPVSFANAGQAIISTKDIEEFGNNFLATSTVRLVILGLDYQMFNPKFVSPDLSTIYQENDFSRFSTILATNWRRIYSFYFQKRFTLKGLYVQSKQSNNIGFVSITTNSGFRADGSFEYGDELHTPAHDEILGEQIAETATSMRTSGQYGDATSLDAIASIDKFLEHCKKNGIVVIGFMAPQPRALYNELMRQEDGFKQSAIELPDRLAKLFNKSGFEFYDTSNAAKTLGASDTEFVDPLHGTDKMYLRIAIYLASHNKTLEPYLDVSKLKRKLGETPNNYLEYP